MFRLAELPGERLILPQIKIELGAIIAAGLPMAGNSVGVNGPDVFVGFGYRGGFCSISRGRSIHDVSFLRLIDQSEHVLGYSILRFQLHDIRKLLGRGFGMSGSHVVVTEQELAGGVISMTLSIVF